MQKKRTARRGHVRIIGGEWRGRRLPVPDIEGLRPSGDRARETVFNWLQPRLHGARCIDLFAGTGVLGLEAVSRGAISAVLVEQSPAAAAALRATLAQLGAGRASVVETDALGWLKRQPAASADLVFVDPPFEGGLADRAMYLLFEGPVVADDGLVYLERARSEPVFAAAPGWEIRREKVLAGVRLTLYRRLPPMPPDGL